MQPDYFKTITNFIIAFTSIIYEAFPFIVLGAVLAGILEEFLPQRLIARFLPRSRIRSVLMAGFLGVVFPMCECGIIPVMRRLLRKGLPLSCCVAYLLAGPIFNVVVLLSTWYAFSASTVTGKSSFQVNATWMVILRAALGYVVAVVTALVVDRLHRKYGDELLTPLARPGKAAEGEGDGAKKPLFKRLSNVSATALHDFVDIMVFLCLGALLAATLRVFVTQEWIEEQSVAYPALSVLLMMVVAVVLCLCSEADAFFAASFTKLVPAAKLSFLVLGPMFDLKLLFMYTRVFRPRLIRTIFLTVSIQVFVYCMALHLWWQYYPPGFMGVPKVEVPVEAPSEAPPKSGQSR